MSYAGANTAVTITLASLASSATAGRESTIVSNSANLDVDHHVYAGFKPQAGTPANDKGVYVFAYGTAGTTHYPDNITGADANLTPTSEGNLALFGFVNIATSNTRGAKFLGSAAALFGGMPEKIGYFVRNFCGFTLTVTAGDHELTYNRIQVQGV